MLWRFDVFLSYNSADDRDVERIAERLREKGLRVWLDRWCLTPGGNWQQEIIQGLCASRACAVFVGSHGLSGWAREELEVAQDRAAKDPDFRLFMVLLPDAPKPDDPSLAFLANRQWVDFRAGIDNPRTVERLVAAITGVVSHPPPLPRPRDDVCPYRGLEVFDEAHAEFFFGRDDDVVRVVEKLKDSRFLAVLGPSGCGKSSLVRAGVIPALKQGALPGSGAWTVRVITPGARPLEVLAAQLVRLFPGESMQRTLEGLRSDERSLDLAVSLALTERPADERVVLVIDQFEQVVTLCADEVERTAFLANLCYASTIPNGRVMVLVAMRADFYHRCAPYPQLRTLMAAAQFLVGPLNRDGLREVIERPAWRVDLKLQDGLVEMILADVAERPGSLPLLEYVLLEVWQHRAGRMLTVEAYVAAGGVQGALAQRANAIYQDLTPAQQQIARRVLLRLVQPGEGTEDIRRRAQMSELLTPAEDNADLEVVVKALADGRLLTTGQDEVSGARVVDVAHEALIRGWPQLRAWIDKDRELLRARRRLTEAAADWDANSREEGFHYRGLRLAAWQDRPLDDLNGLERAFLAASQAREERERTGRRLRVRLALVSLSTALAIISALIVLAASQRDLAFSRELAASAKTQMLIDPELSLLLAREALAARRSAEAEAVLRQATLDSRVRVTLRGHTGPVDGVAFSPNGKQVASTGADGTVRIWDLTGEATPIVLGGHTTPVNGVAFSPNGQQVASTGADGTVRIWQTTGAGRPIILRGHTGPVNDVAFSPNGQQVASTGNDGAVRIWDLASAADPVVLRGHTGPVNGVAFSPDGQRLASTGNDGTVRIWDLTGEAAPVILRSHTGTVAGVAFSPDGQRLASTSDDGAVRIWDLASEGDPAEFRGHTELAFGIAFSLDGRRVAAAGGDGAVRIWDLADGAPIVLRGHQGPVRDVAFSPDGQRLASTSDDGAVRIWDLASAADPAVLRGHTSKVFSVAFSPDGQRLASTSDDGAVGIWDPRGRAGPVMLPGHSGGVFSVTFSPDGQRVAAGGGDGTVRIWDLTGEAAPVILRGHNGTVAGLAFSPDGQRLASAGDDGTVRIWAPRGGADPVVLGSHNGKAAGVMFSPDGRKVASVGEDGTVRIWDLTGEAAPVILRGHNGTVAGLAFSPDGQRLASASNDGTVRIWDPRGGPARVVLHGHNSRVISVAFSPDGQQLASAGIDNTVRVWQTAGGADPIVLRGHTDRVVGVAFSPDGQQLASASLDGTIRIWQCEVCGSIEEVLALAEERVTRELTCEERQTFLHRPCRSSSTSAVEGAAAARVHV